MTRPSSEMYEAMKNALVGDDVLGDDPTVLELEALAASKTGKEAAVFVPSGTMGNQMAIATHCRPGDALIAEQEAHVIYYEVGGIAIFAGTLTFTLPSVRGIMDPEDVKKRITKFNIHTPGTKLICLENTHNRAGGSITPIETMRAYREMADKEGIPIHLDGARVFNAAVGLGVDVKEITSQVDTVNFCLSKGLRAPVGSVLCGPADFIDRARVWRKRLGGGMRQAGLLAACGIVSLNQMVDRLADDHANAKTLARELSTVQGITTDESITETNIVLVHTEEPSATWVSHLHELGLWCFPVADNRLRLVTHADFKSDQIPGAIAAFKEVSERITTGKSTAQPVASY